MPPTSKGPARSTPKADSAASVLKRLRPLCLGIPGAVEMLSHGEPTWRAGPKGKVFAMFDDHHHGAAHVSVYLPAPPGLAKAMVAAEPERYWVPPYVGHRGWVAVVLDTRPDWKSVAALLRAAFDHVASPTLRSPR